VDGSPLGDLEVKNALKDLFEFWLLGDRLSDTTLRNRVMDATLYIVREHGFWREDNAEVITPETISLIWSKTAGDRAIRRLVVDFYVVHGWADEVVLFVDEPGTEFKQDLLLRMLDVARNGDYQIRDMFKYERVSSSLHDADPVMQEPCHYHEHDEQHPACPSQHGTTGSQDDVMQDAEQADSDEEDPDAE
jgi:hypothetical protein